MNDGLTGVVGVIRGSKCAKDAKEIAALRFDIDGLPITEMDSDELEMSAFPGVMHACGHDGHIAAGLGVAKLLMEYKTAWEQTYREIRIIFQPAEEGTRGAEPIVKKGWLNDVTLFLSGHISMGCEELGKIQMCTSGFLASTKNNLTFYGKAAHAAKAPENGRNALLAAANFVVNAQAISRNGQGSTRINVGKLVSGTGRNIIPDQAYLELETRGETTPLNDYMQEQIRHLAEGCAKMYDVSYDMELVGNVLHGVSDRNMLSNMKQILLDMGLLTECTTDRVEQDRADQVEQDRADQDQALEISFEASEDAATMMDHVQKQGGKCGYFIFGTPLKGDHHQNNFDFDEQVLPIMAEFYLRFIMSTCC